MEISLIENLHIDLGIGASRIIDFMKSSEDAGIMLALFSVSASIFTLAAAIWRRGR